MVTEKALNIYNDNLLLKTISHLVDNLANLKCLLVDIDDKTDQERIDLFLKCYSGIFDSIKSEVFNYEISRVLKPYYLLEPSSLDIYNSDLMLQVKITSDVEFLDNMFYKGNLNLLFKYYLSCFKKINSFLLVPNPLVLAKVEAMIDEKVIEINNWLASIYDRNIIENRDKLKTEIVEKLPFKSFTYCASINNAESILKLGILSHNAVVARSISHTDISDVTVNQYRSIKNKYLDNRPAHDFVNMHLNPQNPIIYYFISNAGGNDKLIVFKINPHILVQKNGYFSKGNVAKAVNNQASSGISNNLIEFEKLDWRIINMPNPKNNLYEGRKAEVLIYGVVPLEYIDEIIVYNTENIHALMFYYPNHLGIKLTVNPAFFKAIR